MDVREFLSSLKYDPQYQGQIVHVQYLPPKAAEFQTLKNPFPEIITEFLHKKNIRNLYSHQVEAIEKIRDGENVVLVSGTASGKTLCYNLPIIERLLEHPEDKAFYIFPTKALAQDQLHTLQELTDITLTGSINVSTYDGDTVHHKRKKIRESAHIFITNPDMLHTAILPNHTKWSHVLSHIKFIVIDEIHVYRGVFGSHVALVLRRLDRLIEYYGGKVQYICASATIANPGELARQLTNRDLTVVKKDGAPRGGKHFILWNPPLAKERDTLPKTSTSNTTIYRTSPNIQAQHLLIRLMNAGAQTIAFTRARMATELLYKYIHDYFVTTGNPLAESIKPYRGGYLAETRRQIEADLFSGRLKAVTTTNALELGIDIGSMDACIMVGYPGSIASTWQQAGRAGRTLSESLIFLIASNEPIDQYLMHHPEFLFQKVPEQAIINPSNPYILSAHLGCAAFELPLETQDEFFFSPLIHDLISILEDTGYLKRIKDRWYWSRPGYPSFDTGLRTVTGDTYTIHESNDQQQVIGTIDAQSAFFMLHPGAIYLQEGESYYVKHLDIKRKIAIVEKNKQDYHTTPLTAAQLRLIKKQSERTIRGGNLGFGDVEVTITVFSYARVRYYSSERLSIEKLDLPPQQLESSAFWIEVLFDPDYLNHEQISLMEGLVGIKNLVLVILPILAMCDRNDIGGLVDVRVFGHPAIFIYDRYPGGMGFAERGFSDFPQMLDMLRELIQECECESGCPACVGAIDPAHAFFKDMDEKGAWILPNKKSAKKILDMLIEIGATAR